MKVKEFAAASMVAAAAALAGAGCESSGVTLDPQSMSLRDTRTEVLTENQVPPDVMQAFHEQSPTGKIIRIERRRYLGGAPYYSIAYAVENGEGRVWDFNP